MNILRRIVSFIILVAAVFVLVGVCMRYDWNGFVSTFKPFKFNSFLDELLEFFKETSNAIVLTMLGFIGLTMPNGK